MTRGYSPFLLFFDFFKISCFISTGIHVFILASRELEPCTAFFCLPRVTYFVDDTFRFSGHGGVGGLTISSLLQYFPFSNYGVFWSDKILSKLLLPDFYGNIIKHIFE